MDPLILVSLFLLILFFTYILIIEFGTKNVEIMCPVGTCPTDRITGEKNCTNLIYDVALQTCNPEDGCSIGNVINSDNSTSNETCQINPVTGKKSRCRCVKKNSCPDYITSIFRTTTGSPYGVDLGRTSFYQEEYNSFGSILPDGISDIKNAGLNFCGIPLEFMFRSSPGCDFVDPTLPINKRAIQCLNSNPCIQGYAAYVTDDFSSFSARDFERLSISCVANNPLYSSINNMPLETISVNTTGTVCMGSAVPVYDTTYGFLSCVEVDLNGSRSMV